MTKLGLIAAAIFASSAFAASASTVTVSGSAIELDPPPLAVNNNPPPGDDDNILWFKEASNVTVSSAVTGLGGTSIGVGDVVDVYMMFLNRDSRTSSGTADTATATFTFTTQILGIFGQQNGSDLVLTDGLSQTTTYSNFSSRGIEIGNNGTFSAGGGDDLITHVLGSNEVGLFLRVTQPGDWVRVVTVSAVPVPAALPLMLVGLGGLAFVARRRKTNASV
jgi:hypothetical protein